MNILIPVLLSLILLAAGYGYVCFYLSGTKWSEKQLAPLRPDRNKVLYLICALVVIAGLLTLFEGTYHLALLPRIKLLCLVMLLFPAAAIDLRVQKIPNLLVLTGLIVRCVLYIPEFILSPKGALGILKDNLLGAVVIGLFFLIILLLFKNSIGMGDVKLFAVIGLYQGLWGGINSVFFSLVASFVLSVFLLITKKKSRKDTISFGPSILVGTVVAMALAGM